MAKPTESQRKTIFPSLDPVTSSLEIFPKKRNSNYRKSRKRRSFTTALPCQPTGDLAESIMVKPGVEMYGEFAQTQAGDFPSAPQFPSLENGFIRLYLMSCLGDFKKIIAHPDQHSQPPPGLPAST